jgi:multiple sugar transport system substrate-binding protein
MKNLTLSLVLIVVLTLAACGSPATPAPEKPAQPQPAATQPPAAAEKPAVTQAPPAAQPVEITFMMWGAPEELQVWQAVVDDFHKVNPNIKVNVEVSDWDSYWTKLNTLIAGGTPPDLFAMDAPLYLDWQSRGALLNLKPYLDKEPGFLDGFYPQTLKAYELADGYYGMPRDFQTIVLFYNKDMFDAAGVPYPTADWTYDDLKANAQKLTLDKDGDGKTDQYGLWTDVWDMELFWSEAIWAHGGEIINPDHTQTLIGGPEARKAWEYIDGLFKDSIMPNPATAGEYGGDLFQSGVAAMTTIGHWAVPGYVQSGINFGVAPLPKGPAGQATSVNSAGFVVSNKSQNPDAAWEFIKFALSEAGQSRLAQLGFAIPVLKSVATSDAYLKQPGDLDQKVFLDALDYAHMKPVFRGYEEWSAVVGDGLTPVWDGDAELGPTLDEVVKGADEVLAQNK